MSAKDRLEALTVRRLTRESELQQTSDILEARQDVLMARLEACNVEFDAVKQALEDLRLEWGRHYEQARAWDAEFQALAREAQELIDYERGLRGAPPPKASS